MDNFGAQIGPEFFSPNISASKAKFENRVGDPESTLLKGSQLKNELASDLGRSSSCNSGTSVFVLFVLMQELMGARKEQIEQKMRFLAIQAQQERNEFDRVLK